MNLNINFKLLILILINILSITWKIFPQFDQNQVQLPIVNSNILLIENQISDNPAMLHFIDDNYASFSYIISKFGLKEISPVFADAGMKINDELSGAISLYGLGDEKYNEFSVLVITSYKITDKVVVGGACEYARMSIKDFYSDFTFQFHFGTILKISNDLTTGFSLKNITRSFFRGGENTANQNAIAGICYSPDANIAFEFSGIVRIGLQSGFLLHFLYRPFEIITLRVSYATAPKLVNVGIRLNTLDWINFTINLQYHSNLGYTYAPAVSFFW